MSNWAKAGGLALFWLGLLHVFQARAEPPDSEAQINSVLVLNNEVYASDYHYLYRADLSDKVWSRLPQAVPLPVTGRFVKTKVERPRLIFFYGPCGYWGSSERPMKNAGLYALDRDDLSWKLVSKAYTFEDVLQLENGTLYAIGRVSAQGKSRDYIISSNDAGRTWEDMTKNLAPHLTTSHKYLIHDPEQPNQIAVRLPGERRDSVVLWREGEWRIEETRAWTERTGDFFDRDFRFSGIQSVSDYLFHATFGSYFEFQFDGNTSIDPFELTLDRQHYEFKQSGAKEIVATLHFRRADHAAAIMDLRRDLDFWGLKIEDSDGDRFTVRPLAKRRSNSGSYEQIRKSYEQRPDLIKAELIRGKPYSRKIDLAKLYRFRHRGLYKVQLIYACPFWAGEGRTNWTGSFGGPMVEIEIK